MQSDMQQKQSYLRNEILDKGFEPQKFIQYLDSRLSIGDDLSLCTLEQLKIVVDDFVAFEKLNRAENKEEEKMRQPSISQKSSLIQKPRPVVFDRYSFSELEFSKKYSCIKINDRFNKQQTLHCQVANPQRKTVGGFFGLGATSFLEFEVRTVEMNWCVGRRYSDFTWLRNHLKKMYPTQIVPPIPEKKSAKKTQRHVEKRMRILTYFLNDLVSIPQFLNNKIVQGFLKIKDLAKFTQMKEDGDKMKPTATVNHVETVTGQIMVNFNLQNKAYLEEMKKVVPQIERLYKNLTRQGKALQTLHTDQVNTLYEMGNYFAQLHEKSKDVMNRIPKASGMDKLNEIYILMNNMTIEWGNIIRNQFQIFEKNWNTFFKYIRNDLFGYLQIFEQQNIAEQQFCKAKTLLDKKKDKVYGLFDPSKWQLPKQLQANVNKEVIHDKVKAFQLMLPKQSKEVEHLRINNALYISQLFQNGNYNINNSVDKFRQNFKEWSINLKVNTQQIVELWSQMAMSFSGQKKIGVLKEKPLDMDKGDMIMDD